MMPEVSAHSRPAPVRPSRMLAALLAPAACIIPLACGGGSAGAPRQTPQRVVSLIPAVTETLFSLGAGDRLVGRTRWGVHPPPAREVADVGDGMRPSVEAVVAREPDLVILYEGEGNRTAREQLERLGVRTLSLRHDTLEQLRRNIFRLGDVLGCPASAAALAARIDGELAAVAAARHGRPRVRVYFDIAPEPPITIGRGSFLDSLVTIAGGTNVFGDLAVPSPRVSLEAIVERNPERILTTAPAERLNQTPDLASRHGWSGVPAVAEGRISTLDGDLIGRLGPRVGEAAWAIARRLDPALAPPAPAPHDSLARPDGTSPRARSAQCPARSALRP